MKPFILIALLSLFSLAYAYDCGGGAYPTASFWLRFEDDSGGAGLQFADACAGNNFTRLGPTYKTVSLWDYGHAFTQPVVDNWAVMDNASALTTGSRSWGLVLNQYWYTYSTGMFSDNESAYGTDWGNYLMFEADGGLYCYCRQGDNGLRAVYAPVPLQEWETLLCTYDTSDSNNLSVYVNGTLIASAFGDPCNFPITQGQSVIDSYPVVGVWPRTWGIYDEAYYFKGAVNASSAYCLWAFNNLDCTEHQPPVPGGGCDNASLYTTKGFVIGGFNDSDSCSITVTRNDTANVVEARTITNDCLASGGARLTSDCYIYPFNSEVSYSVFLDKRYSAGRYDVTVRCGGVTNASYCFHVKTPSLSAVDFNQYPQFLTTMKLVARTDTEATRECTARIISESGSTTAVVPGVLSAEQGFFSFEHFLLWEAPYSNYTLNVTCNDLSTFQTTFKPVFVDEGVLGGVTFGLGFQAVLVVIAVLFAVIILVCAHLFWKAVTDGVRGVK